MIRHCTVHFADFHFSWLVIHSVNHKLQPGNFLWLKEFSMCKLLIYAVIPDNITGNQVLIYPDISFCRARPSSVKIYNINIMGVFCLPKQRTYASFDERCGQWQR